MILVVIDLKMFFLDIEIFYFNFLFHSRATCILDKLCSVYNSVATVILQFYCLATFIDLSFFSPSSCYLVYYHFTHVPGTSVLHQSVEYSVFLT